ncbi:uncharacterized protein LOC120634701 [Pararge aegeria]|uniref:uncharacterized protein LOC120634701 n=1 Tax=Pararge aegeria TaxID=116150 RepID=UPI0019CF959C|nr:uncharacterized protein LOC120634701 [Pararge aegeria]
MWLYNFYLLPLVIITFLINCYCVENKEPKKELYGNIYLAKNVPHTQIKKKFLDIINSVLHAMESTRKLNSNGKNIELKGTIVILENIENDKYETRSEEKTITSNFVLNNQNKKIEKLKYLLGFGKDHRKILMLIMDNRKERETLARDGLSIEDSSFETRNLPKDNKKRNETRDTYANYCMKLAVRKCYKALVAVNRNVCKSRYRCSSSFQSTFKKNSKVGCIRNFDYSKVIIINTKNKKKRTSAKFKDATREGYLDACIPYMVPNYQKKHSAITQRNNTLTNYIANMLRKRSVSERKCQSLSRARCVTACFYALKESCATHECPRRRRTSYNKACKDECRRAYRVRRSDRSDSSSNSDSSY